MIETYLAAIWNSTRASIKAGKRLLALMLAATVLITAFPAFHLTANAESDTPEVWNGAIADNFGGGEGTAESPFRISTGGQLAYLAQQVNGGERYSGEYFKLTSDIVLNDVKSASDWDEDTTGLNSWTPIGTSDPTSKPFSGTFDGGGHTVSGIYISSGDDYQGLFGDLGSGGTIKNVGVTDSYVKGKRYVGGVAGSNNGTIQTCYNTGSVNGSQESNSVGGVAGSNSGTIQTCYNTGSVSGNESVGGIAGTNYGTIQACYSTGSVTGSTSVGGIVGENHISIQKCYYDSTTSDISLGVGNTSEDFTGIAEGKTTDEMQSDTAFEGWDEEVWLFESGKYPQLKAFIPLVKWQDESTGTDTGWYEDSKDSFALTTAAELAGLAKLVNDGNDLSGKTVTLGNDIVLNDVKSASDWDEDTTGLNSWTPIGTSDPTSKPFSGTFDGGGHTVSGIYISSGDDYQGLFGDLGSGGTIKNVGVTDSYIRGNQYVGGVAGDNEGTIQTCYNTGSVSGTEVAAGGVAGLNASGTIQTCYNTGSVSGTGGNVGGVAGDNEGTIQTCYNTGSVAGESGPVGGVAGNNGGTIQTCCYDSTTSDISLGIGNTSEDATGIAEGKATDDMQSGTAFEGWDEDVWLFEAGKYPQLKALIPSDDGTGGVDTDWYDNDESEFTLTTAAELAGLAKLVNDGNDFSGKTVTLGNDIVLNDVENASDWDEDTTGLNLWTPIGTYDSELDEAIPFSGTFDGNDHTVSGIYISSGDDYQGLFGYLGSGGTFENVGVTDSYIRGNQYVGGVVGYNYNGIIQNCYNTGSVTGTGKYVGGMVGYTNGGMVQTCYNAGSVAGNITVGGVEGSNYGIIKNCYNTGSVTGSTKVGGVAGNNSRTIKNCYNTGSVTGSGVAGFNYGTIQNCYYDTINASEVDGAINGEDDVENKVIGKTTDEIQSDTAFEGWDEDVWLFEAGKYPQLKALIPSDDGTGGVDTDWYDNDESEFTLTTAAELAGLAKLVNDGNDFSGKTVTLGKNIILNDVKSASDWDEDTTGLNSWTPIGTFNHSFQGTFDGDGHTVSGIYISSDNDYQGLFGYLVSDGTIKNVGVTDSYVKGMSYVGGVAGYNDTGTIQTCYNTGSVNGSNTVGGVAGYNNTGTIQTCYNTGCVNGNTAGGVAGYSYTGTIQTCYNAGSVTGDRDVGGVAGVNINGPIQSCYNTGIVNGRIAVGGVAGESSDETLSNNYYSGYVGGVGQDGTAAAADVENGTIPFVSCEYTLDADGTTTISELALKDMNEDFKDAFGITGIQYPEKYESSDTDVVTFRENEGEKILTGVASGSATVSGKDEAGITIMQKELTSEGFKGEESTVTGAINLPVTVKGKPQITVFSIQIGDDTYDGTINEDKHTIAVTVPYGTNVEGLIAEFETTPDATVTVEKNVQESGETENDFTDPLTYTVKTEDNTQDYKVTVTVAGETSFQSYSLTDEDGNTYDGTINEDKRTIAVTVPKGTNVKKLTAEFTTSSSVTVEVKGTEQVSGETVNNFTKPVTYKLTAKNGSSQKYKVTVTIHSDNKDDDDKESSHHHSHSSGSAQKPKEPGTKTTVDSGKNSASVSTVANGVRQNGNTAEIHVSVPTITIDSLDSERTLNLSKDASVTVELPKSDIIQQISAGRSANVSLTLPSDAKSDGSSNLAVSINVAKEILEAAKTSGQDMTLAVRYANAQQTAYTWTFQGADLAKSSAPMADVDMRLKVSQTANVPQVNSVTQKNQGVVVQFSQNGALPAPATVTFSAQDQGLNANQSMDLYRYDFSSRQLIPTGKKVAVDAFGNAALTIDRGTDYVLLPDSVKTITLDTCDYTMAAGNSYVTGVTLLNAPAGSYMKTYSSTDGVAATSVLPNGNVKAVGLKPGVTYVMMDLYDKDNKLLTHASVRIVIKEKTTKPSGNSRRQFGIY